MCFGTIIKLLLNTFHRWSSSSRRFGCALWTLEHAGFMGCVWIFQSTLQVRLYIVFFSYSSSLVILSDCSNIIVYIMKLFTVVWNLFFLLWDYISSHLQTFFKALKVYLFRLRSIAVSCSCKCWSKNISPYLWLHDIIFYIINMSEKTLLIGPVGSEVLMNITFCGTGGNILRTTFHHC